MVAVVASATAVSTNNTDATSVTVTKPTGTLEGHLMIAVTHGYVADTFTPPSGWTFLELEDDGASLRSRAYMKTAGASEPANYTFEFQPGPGGGTIGASITTFSGHGGLDTYEVEVWSTADPVDSTFSPTPTRDGIGYVVYTWRDTTSDSATWTGATEVFDVGSGDAGLTQYRGQTGAWETSTAATPGSWSVNPTNSITHAVAWQFFIADAVPANESWASTGTAVELEINGTWIDVTDDVRYEQAVSVTRGTSSQGGQVNPSTASFTLDNISGDYSVLNPTSPHYPYLNLSTPCRISKAYGTVAAEFLGFYNIVGDPEQPVDRFRTPATDTLNITGDIDIRVDVEPETWKMQQVLVAKHQNLQAGVVNLNNGWLFYLNRKGFPVLSWVDSTTLGTFNTVSATAAVGTEIRQALRVTLDVNNGSSGHTVTFYTSDSLDGTWAQLGDAVVTSGTTDLVGNTIALTVGAIEPIFDGSDVTYYDRHVVRTPEQTPVFAPFRGRIYGMELKSGIAGTTVAKPTFDTQTTGTKSLTDAQGNLWTAYGYVVCHNRKYRHHGEITSWPQPRDITGNNAWVDIESTGILNRVQQGTPEEKSALNHTYTDPGGVTETYTDLNYTLGAHGPYTPIGYWSLEDNALPNVEEAQTTTGSSLSTQREGIITGTVEFGADNTFFGSKSAASFKTDSMIRFPITGAIDSTDAGGDPTGAWCVEFIIYAPSGITNGARIAEVRQTGDDRIVRLTYSATNTLVLTVHNAAGTQLATSGSLSATMVNRHNRLSIFSQAGTYFLFYENQSDRTKTELGSCAASESVTGQVYEVRLNANQLMNDVYIAHLAVFDATEKAGQPYGKGFFFADYVSTDMDAWRREPVATRAERLTWKEGIINYNIGDGGPEMGIQGTSSYSQLLQECQATDMGYVYEPRNVTGLGYRTRTSMYNAPVMLSLSYENNDLSGTFSPVRDNRGSVNEVRVEKEFGEFAVYSLTEGNRSVNNPPNGIGRYRDEQTISLYRTRELPLQAGWRVFVGTREDLRVDTITIALENPRIGEVADNIYRFYNADIGDRIQLTDLPLLLLPDDMELNIVGYTETFDQYQHMITFNCAPGSAFAVGQTVGTSTTTSSKTDSSTTTLNEDLDTTETGVDVAVSSGALWTTSGVDFDIVVGGERMTVTSVSGASSPQTFTVTRSVNGVVKAHSTGAEVQLFKKAYTALGSTVED